MRRGGGKQKGAQFEREVCTRLSLWVSAGAQDDLFWRSAMSGGRATVKRKKGEDNVYQAGDISTVSKRGALVTDVLCFECKFVANAGLLNAIFLGKGPVIKYLQQVHDATRFGSVVYSEGVGSVVYRKPVLILKQNRLPILWIMRRGDFVSLELGGTRLATVGTGIWSGWGIWLFDDVVEGKFNATLFRRLASD